MDICPWNIVKSSLRWFVCMITYMQASCGQGWHFCCCAYSRTGRCPFSNQRSSVVHHPPSQRLCEWCDPALLTSVLACNLTRGRAHHVLMHSDHCSTTRLWNQNQINLWENKQKKKISINWIYIVATCDEVGHHNIVGWLSVAFHGTNIWKSQCWFSEKIAMAMFTS